MSERRKDVLRAIDKLDKRDQEEYRKRHPDVISRKQTFSSTTTSNDSGVKRRKSTRKSKRFDAKDKISENSSKSNDPRPNIYPRKRNHSEKRPKKPKRFQQRRSSSLEDLRKLSPKPVKLRDPFDPLPKVPPRRPTKPIYMKNNTPGISSPKKLEKYTDSDTEMIPVLVSTENRATSANQVMIRSDNIDFGTLNESFEGRTLEEFQAA